jgi:hypothetical protein
VKRKKTIIKKLLAFSGLVLFLFIHVAKAVHKHDKNGVKFSSGTKVHLSTDCPICDYHITKDADLPTEDLLPEKETHFTCYHNTYFSRLTSSIGLSYADRGPPAQS